MKLMNKLEKKFGKYAIQNLMYYVIILYVAGAAISFINPYFYYQYLCLDIGAVLRGQVWRIFTFLIQPYSMASPFSVIFLLIELYFTYFIGKSLENAWGTFRFNLYFLSGILFNILAAVIVYLLTGLPYTSGIMYLNRALFLAFAAVYPNMQILFMYIIPIKVKWLGIVYGVFIIWDVLQNIRMGLIGIAVSILVSVMNFIIFFMSSRNYRKINPWEMKRKAAFKREVKNAGSGARHRCTICGRTELDDENLEFRFCSKCDGNHEYCSDHLFTHEHIHKR